MITTTNDALDRTVGRDDDIFESIYNAMSFSSNTDDSPRGVTADVSGEKRKMKPTPSNDSSDDHDELQAPIILVLDSKLDVKSEIGNDNDAIVGLNNHQEHLSHNGMNQELELGEVEEFFRKEANETSLKKSPVKSFMSSVPQPRLGSFLCGVGRAAEVVGMVVDEKDVSLVVDTSASTVDDGSAAPLNEVDADVGIEEENVEIDYDDIASMLKAKTAVKGVKSVQNDGTIPSLVSEVEGAFISDASQGVSDAETTAELNEKSVDDKLTPLKFCRVDVNLQLKALSGVTQIQPLQKRGGDAEENICAVVTYRENRFLHSVSLPIVVWNSNKLDNKRLQAKVHAKWPEERIEDGTGASGDRPSSITLTRTVLASSSNGSKAEESELKETADALGNADMANTNGMHDNAALLSSFSKALAPELVELRVGLMKGGKEIIPMGVATVVISGEECQTIQLNIPVMRDYTNVLARQTKSMFSLTGKSSSKGVHFSGDTKTKYRVEAGAYLSMELKIGQAIPASEPSPRVQINRQSEKIEKLRSLDKMSMYQRLQLYVELRKQRMQPIPLTKSSSVFISEHETKDASSSVTSTSQSSNAGSSMSSFVINDASIPGLEADRCSTRNDKLNEVNRVESFATPNAYDPIALSDIIITSKDDDGRFSPISHDDSRYLSSLHSVLATDHPQKSQLKVKFLKVVSCDPTLFLNEKEAATLKFYVDELVDEAARCAPFYKCDDMSLATDRTEVDDSTYASIESTSFERSPSRLRQGRLEM
ncbi:predicted protein [Thalassiosira pseudonana CCMP1335]|uniref:Uncharacterized protein n=1 Tax=Thalassiosira pseudonana TaxID=35128 RepID=B8BQK7_THAPS|nr:predicted protein [Thalassiosira pseudonana CCMP1335]EED96382.1 predicted protein [Thalassiosira pseudonana CCMP1335]